MPKQITVEIVAKDQFWGDAILVEWADRYPTRKLTTQSTGVFCIEHTWLDSLRAVADECNCKIIESPLDPSRRSLFRQFFHSPGDSKS